MLKKALDVAETTFGSAFRIVANTPTTSLRMWVTFILAIATGIKYLIAGCIIVEKVCIGWVPQSEWLWFLLGLGGIDVAQFVAKRATAWRPPDATNVPTPSETATDGEEDKG